MSPRIMRFPVFISLMLLVCVQAFSMEPQYTFTRPVMQDKLHPDLVKPWADTSDTTVYHAWVLLRDKGISNSGQLAVQLEKLQATLPQATIQRRSKVAPPAGITNFLDIPVSRDYQDQLAKTGVKLRAVSRWFNAVSVEGTSQQLKAAAQLAWVAEITPLLKFHRQPMDTSATPAKPNPSFSQSDTLTLNYGPSSAQNYIINVPRLHQQGYHGEGIIIGMLDTGFAHSTHQALTAIHVLEEYDFINHDTITQNETGDPSGQDEHGTNTLSLIAGQYDGQLYGPAFKASFLLGKTEVLPAETMVEEDYWIAGIEWLELNGAQIVSSSLGYISFSDQTTAFTYSQMNGKTRPTSIAAEIAYQKGVVVVNSIGNDGNSFSYNKMGAPADGLHVISVGAVGSNGSRASFSSYGPTYDGRIKPDVMAMGSGNYHANRYDDSGYINGAGTSYSCPMTAGIVALLLQIHPDWTPEQVIQAIRNTANNAQQPNNSYGWGIIDAYNAAYAPILNHPPSLKLFTGQSLTNAFDMKDYYFGSQPTTYSIPQNFLALSQLSESALHQSSYASATTGINAYRLECTNGSYSTWSVALGKIRYAAYKINKLPHICINAGDTLDFPIVRYTYDSSGMKRPASYGVSAFLWSDDSGKVTVSWNGNSTIRLTASSGFTTGFPVNIHVIASPDSTNNTTIDQDKEVLQVYPNLLKHGTFYYASDSANYAFQLPADRSALPNIYYTAIKSDTLGTAAQGCYAFAFSHANQGVKITPSFSHMQPYQSKLWYTARMRIFSPVAGNNLQSLLYHYNGIVPNSPHVDLSANILFGTPTVWTWIETPLYTQETGIGYPQVILKSGTTSGTIYLDEIQIVQSIPTLIESQRSHHPLNYPYGKFTTTSSLGFGWSTTETYGGAGSLPSMSIADSRLLINFSGASIGTGLKSAKFTAYNHTPGTVYTPSSQPDSEVGLRAYLQSSTGTFNTYNEVFYLACYGVPTNGQFGFTAPPGQFFASGEFGRVNNGWHYIVGAGRNSYHQFQFAVKSSQPGIWTLRDIDYLRDTDEPDFGDYSLLP